MPLPAQNNPANSTGTMVQGCLRWRWAAETMPAQGERTGMHCIPYGAFLPFHFGVRQRSKMTYANEIRASIWWTLTQIFARDLPYILGAKEGGLAVFSWIFHLLQWMINVPALHL